MTHTITTLVRQAGDNIYHEMVNQNIMTGKWLIVNSFLLFRV